MLKKLLATAITTLVLFTFTACSSSDTQGNSQKHIHEYTEQEVPSTCTEKGYKLYLCQCGDSYIENETNELGHSFTDYKSNNNATCINDATETAKCDRCEATDTKVIKDTRLGHSFTDYKPNNNATCVNNATETAKCDRCGELYTRIKEGTCLGHSFTNYVYQGNATCVDDGTEIAICDVCGEKSVRTKKDTALGHDYLINDYDFDTERVNRFCKRLGCEYKNFNTIPLQEYCNSLTKSDIGTTCTFTIDKIQYHIVLIGVDHDSAHTTWQMVEVYDTPFKINNVSKSTGGWGICDMRKTTMNILYNKLQDNVKKSIKTVTKRYLSVNGTYSTTDLNYLLQAGYVSYSSCSDKLFLLSSIEYHKTGYLVQDGTTYDYYKDVTGSVYKYTLAGEKVPHWTRTPRYPGEYTWNCEGDTNTSPIEEHYIAFAFCI